MTVRVTICLSHSEAKEAASALAIHPYDIVRRIGALLETAVRETGSEWTPDFDIRYVRRDGAVVLQQLWFNTETSAEEWRDVPVKEEAP